MRSSTPDDVGPLSGVRVLDLTQFLAGPYGTQLLADLGAEVIKVESLAGDSTRGIPPHFVEGDSAYYLSTNRNKRSLSVDLKSTRGREILLDLADRSDILMENFRPGAMRRLGLEPSDLQARNPALVVVSISGFGQDGPYSSRPAYDVIVQALSGGMSLTGPLGGDPVRAGIPIGDLAGGMCGVIGALAALLEAKQSGRGRHVDVSLLDVQVSMLSYQAIYYLLSGEVPGPQGRDHVSIPTYHSFRCGDGRFILIAANTEPMWQALCAVVHREDLVQDPRFVSNAERLAHKEDLWAMLDEAFLRRPAEEWAAALQDAGVPAAPVNDVSQALDDAQVRHRNMVRTVNRGANSLQLLGSPIKYTGGTAEPEYPPALGEHTVSILEDLLGLDASTIADLLRDGVIAAPVSASSVARSGA